MGGGCWEEREEVEWGWIRGVVFWGFQEGDKRWILLDLHGHEII